MTKLSNTSTSNSSVPSPPNLTPDPTPIPTPIPTPHPLVVVAAIAAVAVGVGASVMYIVPGVRHNTPSTSAGYPPPPRLMGATAPTTCPECGVVVGVRRIQLARRDTGLGAVAGGLLGGVLGNQVGEGNGRTAMTVVGALGGALAGNTAEKRLHEKIVYQIDIHMDNGYARTIRGSTPPPFGPGTRVRVAGNMIVPLR